MVVFITMNLEGLWNVFSGDNHIDCLGLQPYIVLGSLETLNIK